MGNIPLDDKSTDQYNVLSLWTIAKELIQDYTLRLY